MKKFKPHLHGPSAEGQKKRPSRTNTTLDQGEEMMKCTFAVVSGRGQRGTTHHTCQNTGRRTNRKLSERKENEEVTGWKAKTDEQKIEFRKKVMEKGDDKICKYSQLHMSVERERKDHTTSRLQ